MTVSLPVKEIIYSMHFVSLTNEVTVIKLEIRGFYQIPLDLVQLQT